MTRLKFLLLALAFVALSIAVDFGLDPVFRWVAQRLGVAPGLSAAAVGLNELHNFLVALVCTAVLARFARRRVDSYGLAVRHAFGRDMWEGTAVGIAMALLVGIGMLVLGGMQIRGLAASPSALAVAALAWAGATFLAGLAEEFYFRSYFLQTLWKAIGFWPASLVIAALFSADHYFFKPGENVFDVITLVALSLFMCYSVRRTGLLWFAVGFHFAFDFAQLFVIGTPNGSRVPEGRLFDATFHGPAWLTGGVLGTEASLLMYPLIALAWIYVWRRFRARPPLITPL